MKLLSTILLSIFLSSKCFSQIIISENGKYKQIQVPGFGVEVYTDSIVSFSWLAEEPGWHTGDDMNKLTKNVYKVINGDLVKIKSYTSIYTPPINIGGYFLFTDGTKKDNIKSPFSR